MQIFIVRFHSKQLLPLRPVCLDRLQPDGNELVQLAGESGATAWLVATPYLAETTVGDPMSQRRRHLLFAAGVFILAVLVQLLLEHVRVVDSIGWWYTVYAAAAYTVLALLSVWVVALVFRARRRGG